MALTYGFYNSIEGDRVYDAIQFGRIFDGIIKDGVYATYEKGMMVIASSNPAEVIIQPGRAWFNHTWSYNDANVIFEAPAPEVLLERYDALVLEINEELSSRENSFKWVTGTPSSRPERPTLTNTSTIHQYPLCYVHRYPETTMIYKRDITNAIGTSECPFATGVLEGIDLDAWINQWDDEFHNWENTTKTGFETWMLNQEQVYTAWFNSMHSQMDTDLADFEAWFQTIQGIIDEDAALHLQQEIDELRQEATSGSRIFVYTINQSLFGKNVTITEAGGTVFTSRFDNTGVAEFKSIPYVGNLTISSTDGIQTATSVVNTPYYARYNFTIAFWAATVNIAGDPEMSGSTVTVRGSNEILVGTVILDSEGTGIFTATAPDTYKFTLTYGGETMEVTLSVTQETTYTVDLHAAGFKWQDWLEAGGVTGSYSSLDDVLADEVALRRLFTVHASVDYMAGIDKENEDVETIIGNDLAAKWINLRDYALVTLYANTYIAGYMDTADKYFYGEWVITDDTTTPPTWGAKGNVPIMTSNTAPYGTASAYQVFDGNASTTASGTDFSYKFVNPICPKDFYCNVSGGTLQASNNGSTWVVPTSGSHYLYLRLHFTSSVSPHTIQFYGREQLQVTVPTMTSDTAPSGEVIYSSQYNDTYPAWKAFDGQGVSNNGWLPAMSDTFGNCYIGYDFKKKIKPTKVSIGLRTDTSSAANMKFRVEGYTGSAWETVREEIVIESMGAMKNYNISAKNFYQKVRLVYLSNGDYIAAGKGYHIQIYGIEDTYSEREFETGTTKKWLYDHGLTLGNTVPTTTENGYSAGSATVSGATFSNDYVTCRSTSRYDYNGIGSKSINMTPYSMAFAKLDGLVPTEGEYGGMNISGGNVYAADAQVNIAAPHEKVIHLDISNVSGNKKAAIWANSSNAGNRSIKVYEMWLE